MMTETDDAGRPVAFNKVADVVVTGNEDGAHHVLAEISGGLADLGFTVPARHGCTGTQAGAGPQFTDTDEGHEWSVDTGITMAENLYAVAQVLHSNPIPHRRGRPPA